MKMYTVTNWTLEESPSKEVKADNHREALMRSGLSLPGTIVSVKGYADMHIRYQIDGIGRAVKLAHYGSID